MSNRTAPSTLAAVVLVAVGLTGCTAASHSEEADQLRDDLAALPGVRAVAVGYTEPQLFDSADVDLQVRMDRGATPEEVAEVFATSYDALADVHAGEEGNLTVRYGDDELKLRTFESEAEAPDVAAAARAAAVVAQQQPAVLVEVMTQDVKKEPYVESSVWVDLPGGTRPAEVERVRAEIEEVYDGLTVAVRVDTRSR